MTGETAVSPSAGHTVLVVDDDRDIRETLRTVLDDEGYTVATAGNGLEALRYLRASPRPSLILLDLSMPIMDGATFRHEQRRDPRLADIPVVAFSAAAGVAERVRPLDVAGYLRKPIRLDELLAMVQRFA